MRMRHGNLNFPQKITFIIFHTHLQRPGVTYLNGNFCLCQIHLFHCELKSIPNI